MERDISIIYLIWTTFTLLSGVLEAFLFNKYKKTLIVLNQDVHVWFTFIRIIVATPLCMYVFFTRDIGHSILTAVVFILCFPHIHDSSYYTTRELLHKGTYPKMWRTDRSWNNLSSAKNSFSFRMRAALFIVAILMCIYREKILC